MSLHNTVLLNEAVDALQVLPDGIYIDGTFGRGGHTKKILDGLGKHGKLLAFDKDSSAIMFGKEHFAADSRLEFINSSFTLIDRVSMDRNLVNNVNGVLLDLGLSNPQLTDSQRGFSFNKSGPLDMRMDQSLGMTAADWLNRANVKEIAEVFWKYGEEKNSKRIAKKIAEFREEELFSNTMQLSKLCEEVASRWKLGKHPATRVFQAIRIYINRELEDLYDGLQNIFKVLAPGGRLVVISFHSLEDRIVKRFMQQMSSDNLPRKMPLKNDEVKIFARRIGKKIRPTPQEIYKNAQARSAVMRVLEKINDSDT